MGFLFKQIMEIKRKNSFKDRTGEKSINNQGYEMEIVKYITAKNCDIRFNDEFGTLIKNCYYKDFPLGSVKNKNHRAMHGVGYIGWGKYDSGKNKNIYMVWCGMLERCYSEKYRSMYSTYENVTICEEWQCFQNFAKWYSDNYRSKSLKRWPLDKDILMKENKLYSPETCCFVPQEINSLFTKRQNGRGAYPIGVSLHPTYKKYSSSISKWGKRTLIGFYDTADQAFNAYKTEKEKYIKEVADKWRDQIDQKVYEAMYKYEVNIND